MSADQSSMNQLITDNIDIWTSTVKTKSASGRGSSKKRELYGVKKLRELILELAVRGKLAPQDPTDEPASVLLEKNYLEQARLVSQENLKTKATLEILPDDDYLAAPISWGRVRLGNLAKFIDYRGKTPKKIDSGVRLITAKNVKFGYISLVPEEFISEEEYDSWMTRGFPRVGDILFTPEAPLGNVAQVDLEEKFALAQRAICFQLHIPEVSNFLKLFSMTPSFQNLLSEKATGTTAKGIKASVLKELLIYLPPEQEQHRIVEKVDELMALCDQLEEQTEASIAAHQVLVSTLLDTLTNSANAEELMQNWQMVAENFDTLFTTEASIDQLKQTILQLAVMGKLVPQDPTDEPAAKLLERIAEEKTQLIKEKKIKKQKALPPITDDEKPFELPNGWEWCRFDEIIDQRFPLSYGVLVPGNHVEGGVPLVRIGDIDLTNPAELPEKSISAEIDSKYERTRLFGGEILMAVVGSIGKLGVVPDSWKGANIARALCRIWPWEGLSKNFLLVLLQSNYMQNSFTGDTRTLAQPTLNIGLIKNSLTPIPPLSEQLKIVSMVSDLFVVCDNLKVSIKESQTIQLHLTDAIVEKAV